MSWFEASIMIAAFLASLYSYLYRSIQRADTAIKEFELQKHEFLNPLPLVDDLEFWDSCFEIETGKNVDWELCDRGLCDHERYSDGRCLVQREIERAKQSYHMTEPELTGPVLYDRRSA